jgi:hypothetical protein
MPSENAFSNGENGCAEERASMNRSQLSWLASSFPTSSAGRIVEASIFVFPHGHLCFSGGCDPDLLSEENGSDLQHDLTGWAGEEQPTDSR